ncbi:MAG: potassium-transporting ATPase subunit KdpA [Phycisphaerales bacterium]|nr:potassium-transporting ATPase subunit KdpA [Phycisphaerales bacterium]
MMPHTLTLAAMTGNGVLQLVLYLVVLVALVKPLGWFMARVFDGAPGTAPLGFGTALGWLERVIYRLCGIRVNAIGSNPANVEMGWKPYAVGILLFNVVGFLAVYALQRLQHLLPANPAGLGPVEGGSAFNTAISFVSNTNWQGYGGEVTMSYLTQMLGLGVQNFLSAAKGIAVLVALIRGLSRKSASTIGNCWVDLTRVTLYVLLPLSAMLAIALVSQGVVQTFNKPQQVALTVPLSYSEPVKNDAGEVLKNADGTDQTRAVAVTTQTIPLGPAASQIAIKQLGTNGGGFFNVNSAHPLENPTPLSNFLQVLAILLIPAALCFTFGEMVKDRRQGWAVLAAMLVIFVPLLAATYAFEATGNPRVAEALGTPTLRVGSETPTATRSQDAALATRSVAVAENMEGKETRFGIANSATWAAATTAASNGSVNSMHDSFTPLGGLIPMWLMQLGEVVFGGVGSGLYGMLMFVIVAVFVAGLMVGRTPEYLGKKIEPFEMKMAAIVVLVPCALVLVGTAVAVILPQGTSSTSNPGPHGFSQILYAFSSAGNNNGSAFAGLSANTLFYNLALGLAMWFSRFWIIVPVLAVAGSLAAKKVTPTTSGTLPTHTPVFVLMLVAVVIVVGALTFVPALALGPIVEHLQLHAASK